jgi:transcriptional regulator with XRE-family HTH domain
MQRNLTQDELGDLSGIGRTHVNRIETGETYRPKDETIQKLAAAMDMPMDELLANVEPPLMLREDRGLYAVDLDDDDLLQLYARMQEPDRKRLVAIARALWILNAEG